MKHCTLQLQILLQVMEISIDPLANLPWLCISLLKTNVRSLSVLEPSRLHVNTADDMLEKDLYQKVV